eukprot:350521-Chlamydomonas_euryale.AAC.17
MHGRARAHLQLLPEIRAVLRHHELELDGIGRRRERRRSRRRGGAFQLRGARGDAAGVRGAACVDGPRGATGCCRHGRLGRGQSSDGSSMVGTRRGGRGPTAAGRAARRQKFQQRHPEHSGSRSAALAAAGRRGPPRRQPGGARSRAQQQGAAHGDAGSSGYGLPGRPGAGRGGSGEIRGKSAAAAPRLAASTTAGMGRGRGDAASERTRASRRRSLSHAGVQRPREERPHLDGAPTVRDAPAIAGLDLALKNWPVWKVHPTPTQQPRASVSGEKGSQQR